MPTYTYHRLWLSVVLCDDSALVYKVIAAYFTTHAFHSLDALKLNYLFLYRFLSGVWLSCKEGNEKPSEGKPSHSAGANTCLLFIYPYVVHSFTVNGIISRCPIDRIHVASENAISTNWFWSASRTYPNWQFNGSLCLFENH